MNDFFEYMNKYIDFREIIVIIVSLIAIIVCFIIKYFADKYYCEVIEPIFSKYRSGEKLTDKERQIIDKYKV